MSAVPRSALVRWGAGLALALGIHTAGAAALLARWSASADAVANAPAITVDLVSACYFHSPVEFDRAAVLRQAADLMGIGGTLVVVDHASTAPWSWAEPDTQYPSPEQTWAAIGLGEDWTPLTLAARERLATGPNGERALVTDNVIVARRTDEQPFSARAEREIAALRAKPDDDGLVSER